MSPTYPPVALVPQHRPHHVVNAAVRYWKLLDPSILTGVPVSAGFAPAPTLEPAEAWSWKEA